MTFQGSWRQGSDHVCHQGNVAVNQLEKAEWEQRKTLRRYAYVFQIGGTCCQPQVGDSGS